MEDSTTTYDPVGFCWACHDWHRKSETGNKYITWTHRFSTEYAKDCKKKKDSSGNEEYK